LCSIDHASDATVLALAELQGRVIVRSAEGDMAMGSA
jgi:hypothetical protein